MKKSILFLMMGLAIFCLVGCGNNENKSDAARFKEDYEKLNGEVSSSGSEYREVSIPQENPFVYVAASEIVEKIENGEDFYVYFGSPACPWCRSVIEKAIMVANQNGINQVFYVDIWDEERNEILRDKYKLNDDGEVELVASGTDEYYELLRYFDEVLNEYTLIDEDGKSVSVGEKRIFAPSFIYVEDGKVVSLETGVSSKQSSATSELTDEILEDEEGKFNDFFIDNKTCGVDASC